MAILGCRPEQGGEVCEPSPATRVIRFTPGHRCKSGTQYLIPAGVKA